jgi:hypothetical protein
LSSKGKAVGSDGMVDFWIKKTERKNLLMDLWNNDLLEKMPSTFRVDLVPLNKVWP